MSDQGTINDLKQAILSRIELHGLESAQKRYVEVFPPLSVERQRIQRVFADLEQDEAGHWRFRK
jgi:hypothetical protein